MDMLKNHKMDKLKGECMRKAAELSRAMVAEGAVLLENEGVLPFEKTSTISIFGRTHIDYIKSGTGSGGSVNTEYTVNILEGLRGRIGINEELVGIYEEWLKSNPFDNGKGWASQPWVQEEMPVTDEICKNAAEKSDAAVVVIGRTAGEDKDNSPVEGSYLITKAEEELLATVTRHFKKVCVLLNVGNIIDMKWVKKYHVPCVMYCWQGGQEGGNAIADLLLGNTAPSGRLTDTIAHDIADYPSTANFGHDGKVLYEEDIFVGYRYFESFAKDKVLYPFGFGLSYTEFEAEYSATVNDEKITITAKVKNVGERAGKTVIQAYYEAPQGRLGKPLRQLAGYKKTPLLASGEACELKIEVTYNEMASYEDKAEFAYILEAGEYTIYVGENVRAAKEVARVELRERIVKKLRQALAPITEFERFRAVEKDGTLQLTKEQAPLRQYDIHERMKEHILPQEPPVGNRGIKLQDVIDGKHTMDEFIMQLSVAELSYMVKGLGFCNNRVRPGSSGACGGLTNDLLDYGIHPACCCDGPSGIRLETKEKATLIPNGTCFASSWNDELVEALYSYIGVEVRSNEVDLLLGPGMNIHRNPMNGRNFEYFSEDPLLTGKIASACTRGLASAGVSGVIKHFACNSQEFARNTTDSVVSERALREIYLKPFEIAVAEGKVLSIMTAYNMLNGTYTGSNYDLTTSILRDEWGFDGFVMTDWWPYLGVEGGQNRKDLKEMVRAQNDIYMTVGFVEDYGNLISEVYDGLLDIAYLRKCVKNLLNVLVKLPSQHREPIRPKEISRADFVEMAIVENARAYEFYEAGDADAVEFEYVTAGSEVAQYGITISNDWRSFPICLVKGSPDGPSTALAELPELPYYEGKVKFLFDEALTSVKLTFLKRK